MFRISTEDVNRELTIGTVKKFFPSFAVTTGIGVWKDNIEKSIHFDIVVSNIEERKRVLQCAEAIRIQNNQECVLVIEFSTKETFV